MGEVIDARITTLKPLKFNEYGFILTEQGVQIGKGALSLSQIQYNCVDILLVITLYSKTGGKYGKHGSVTVSSNVSAISYTGVQVFEHSYALQFRAVPQATVVLQTKQFAHLGSISFLSLLSSIPKVTGVCLEVSQEDGTRFKDLLAGQGSLFKAMRLFRKRVKGSGAAEAQDE